MSHDECQHLSRRQFMGRAAVATAGAAGAAAITPMALAAKDQSAIEQTRSYNPEMEYRRLGKTGLWVSAICMGGHWKRVDKILKSTAQFAACEGPLQATTPEVTQFMQNRTDVIGRARCLRQGTKGSS